MPAPTWIRPIGATLACLAAFTLTPSTPAAAPTAMVISGTAQAAPSRPGARTDVEPAGPSFRSERLLPAMLARFDAMPPGPARDEFALAIDRHAGQRYATVSRLYWHTQLDTAKAAARATGRPILALRMLGRLDEELSCANSRMFRATLYANARVSRFLREHFVLYWSSERAVPKVTIDYGDGRTIQGTTTGNSAHYVLDATGGVLDVLPGLYAPTPFTDELTRSLELASAVRALDGAARSAVLSRYHQDAVARIDQRWATTLGAPFLPGRRQLMRQVDVDSALALAQRATFAKAYIEVPQLRSITAGADPGTLKDDDLAMWAAAGQRAWNLGGARSIAPAVTAQLAERGFVAIDLATTPPSPPPPEILDRRSRALITQLHTAGGMAATAAQLASVIARLEHHVVADSALNQFKLRPQIHQHLSKHPQPSFEELNRWIYTTVFHTPPTDAWLGLLPRVDFTGLPGDGTSAR